MKIILVLTTFACGILAGCSTSPKLDDAAAAHKACYSFSYGQNGKTQDYEQAFKWCSLAADKGNSSSQTLLAELYLHGSGVPKDLAKASYWYKLAAEQGHSHAQLMYFLVNNIYRINESTKEEKADGKRFLEKAVEQKYDKAISIWETLTPAGLDAEKFLAEAAVILFSDGCITYYPDPKAFDAWIKKNHFDPVTDVDATGLIREPGGTAYSVNNNGVRYLLVAQTRNLCTVFVKEINLEYSRHALSRVREKLRSQGWKETITSDDVKSGKDLITTGYDYYLNGEWEMTLVISESESKSGFSKLAMSATSRQRANQTFNGDFPRTFNTSVEPLEKSSSDCAPEAIAKAREGAERGDAPSLYLMARYYSTGKCLPGDENKAIDLYQKAAQRNYPPAFYNLGMIMAANQEFQKAEELFVRGVELGHRGAELQLGILYSLVPPPVGDDKKAFAWLSITAKRAEPVAVEAKDILDTVTQRLSPEGFAEANALYAKLKDTYEAIPAFHF